jgi:acetoin utilization deacetylase AcuC-like enzyme
LEECDVHDLIALIRETHDGDYLDHLKTACSAWLKEGLIEEDDSILPECFPVPNKAHAKPRPPKDIFARPGYFAFDMSSGIMQHTYGSVLASANLASTATHMLSNQKLDTVFALTRPPGHHCTGRQAGGYCYINNAAVVVSQWRQQYPNAKVGILDVDFHHGNGTQDLFYHDDKLLYVSIHGEDEFPYYTGGADETGAGSAMGTNLNLPLKTGSSFEAYMDLVRRGLESLKRFAPDVLVVSLGFDTFRLDPLGSFDIDIADYYKLAREIRKHLALPTLILLEGGYAIESLGSAVLGFLDGWESL